MGNNLRNRLQQIRKAKKGETISQGETVSRTETARKSIDESPGVHGERFPDLRFGLFPDSEWLPAGFQVLKRTVKMDLPFPLPRFFPSSLDIIVRDLFRYGNIPNPQDLVFFDLETTGLSGGAGTIAFLGSFGRLDMSRKGGLVVEQYLLLDYPGEGDFLEALKAELQKSRAEKVPSVVVSYNGKTFDSQILKNRCLMNATIPPDYFHADLLHPCRRLWKRLLPDCSQSTIETQILGIDRTGDIPGALAPEIWFSFLKTGETWDLVGICDHNLRDIQGLASLFLLLGNIAAAPLEVLAEYNFDLEALALLWRETVLRRRGMIDDAEKKQAGILLNAAAKRHLPRALFVLGLDMLKAGQAEQGRGFLLTLANSDSPDDDLRAAAFRSLAIDAEWRQRDMGAALAHTESGLALPGIRNSIKNDLERRRERLQQKKHLIEAS